MGQDRLIAVEAAECDLCGALLKGGEPVACGHRAAFCGTCFDRLRTFGRVVPHRSCPDCQAAVWETKPRKRVVYD